MVDDIASGIGSVRGRIGSRAGGAEAERLAALSETGFWPSGARQGVVALAFLFLLPFLAGWVVMVMQRITDGLWFDMPGLAVLGAGLIAIFAFVTIELIYSLRAKLVLAKTAVRFTLPAGGGPTPLLSYRSEDIPYHAIKSVELRREVFGGRFSPVLLRGLVIRTKDNREIPVGHMMEDHAEPAFPFDRIGAEIARRAAVPFVDQRTIWRRSRKERALGFISEYDTANYILDPDEVVKLNLAHRRIVLGLASALLAFVLLAILAELQANF